MKKLSCTLIVMCVALSVTASSAMATKPAPNSTPDLSLGTPNFVGNGCSGKTARATLSPDKKTVSVLFDSYLARAGQPTNLTTDRKQCNLHIPVHLPAGLSIATYKIDYRGFNNLPAGSSSKFEAEYFFGGQQGPSAVRTFTGPLTEDFTVSDDISPDKLIWSKCGMDGLLKANTSITVVSNASKQQALTSVDSADLTGGLRYYIQWKPC